MEVATKHINEQFLDSLYKLLNDSLDNVNSSGLEKKRKRNSENDDHGKKVAIKSVNNEMKETLSFIELIDGLTGKKSISVDSPVLKPRDDPVVSVCTKPPPITSNKETKLITSKPFIGVKPSKNVKTVVSKPSVTSQSTTKTVQQVVKPLLITVSTHKSLSDTNVKYKIVSTSPVKVKPLTITSVTTSKLPPLTPLLKGKEGTTALATTVKSKPITSIAVSSISTTSVNCTSTISTTTASTTTTTSTTTPSTSSPKISVTSITIQRNKPSEFMCYHCNIQFQDKQKFYEHLKGHEKKEYQCENCHKTFNVNTFDQKDGKAVELEPKPSPELEPLSSPEPELSSSNESGLSGSLEPRPSSSPGPKLPPSLADPELSSSNEPGLSGSLIPELSSSLVAGPSSLPEPVSLQTGIRSLSSHSASDCVVSLRMNDAKNIYTLSILQSLHKGNYQVSVYTVISYAILGYLTTDDAKQDPHNCAFVFKESHRRCTLIVRKLDENHLVEINCLYCLNVGVYTGNTMLKEDDGKSVIPLTGDISNDVSTVTKRNLVGKVHCCLYCKRFFTEITKHLTRIHARETEVKEALKFDKNSYQRGTIFKRLRIAGDYEFNRNTSVHNRILIRRSNNTDLTNYVTCPTCLSLISKSNYADHKRSCSGSDANNERLTKLALENDMVGRSNCRKVELSTTKGVHKELDGFCIIIYEFNCECPFMITVNNLVCENSHILIVLLFLLMKSDF